jgi:hypothetical protein
MNHERVEDDELLNPPGELEGANVTLESRDDLGVDASQVTQTQGAGIETQTSVEELISSTSLELGYDVPSGPGHVWRHVPEYGIEHNNPFPILNSPLPGPPHPYNGTHQHHDTDSETPSPQGHPMHPSLRLSLPPRTAPAQNGSGLMEGGEMQTYPLRPNGPARDMRPLHPDGYRPFLPDGSAPGNLQTSAPSHLGYRTIGSFPPQHQSFTAEPGPSHPHPTLWNTWPPEYTGHYHPSHPPCPGAPHSDLPAPPSSAAAPGHGPAPPPRPAYPMPYYRGHYHPYPALAGAIGVDGSQDEHYQNNGRSPPRSSQRSRKASNPNKKKPKKSYFCKECNGAFERPSNLVVHIRKHTGERPFACGVCPSRFPTNSNLTRHERRLHPEEWARKHPNPTSRARRVAGMGAVGPGGHVPTYGGMGNFAGNGYPVPFVQGPYTSQMRSMYHGETARGLAPPPPLPPPPPPPPSAEQEEEEKNENDEEEGTLDTFKDEEAAKKEKM